MGCGKHVNDLNEIMRTLQSMYEGILGDIETEMENAVEMRSRMETDLLWIANIPENRAPHFEAAMFNVSQDAFRQCAGGASAEFKYNFAVFMAALLQFDWSCDNFDTTDNWEEREYTKRSSLIKKELLRDAQEMIDAKPNAPEWNWNYGGSFYHWWWDPDYTHSLDQEDLLDGKYCQMYSKQLLTVARKYGLKLKPIF